MLYDTLVGAAFQEAPEELDVTITETSSQHLGAVEQAAAALTAEVSFIHAFTFSDGNIHPLVCSFMHALNHAWAQLYQGLLAALGSLQ